MEVVSSGPVSCLLTPRFSHVLNGYPGNGQPVASHDKARNRSAVNDTLGADISKASLAVWRLSDRKHMRFSNAKSGLGGLCKWLGPDPVRVVHEATGRCHRDLEAVGGLEAQGPHLRRSPWAAHLAVHAGRHRDPIQRPAQEDRPRALRRRKALKGRDHGGDAQAHRPRQRPDPRQPERGRNCPLIKTDTADL